MGPIISRSHYTIKYEGIIMMDQDIWNPFLGWIGSIGMGINMRWDSPEVILISLMKAGEEGLNMQAH